MNTERSCSYTRNAYFKSGTESPKVSVVSLVGIIRLQIYTKLQWHLRELRVREWPTHYSLLDCVSMCLWCVYTCPLIACQPEKVGNADSIQQSMRPYVADSQKLRG